MEETPSLNMPVQRLKVATLPLDLPYSGLVTHSGEILTTDKSHGKKPDRNYSHRRYEIHGYKLQPSVIGQVAKLTCSMSKLRRG